MIPVLLQPVIFLLMVMLHTARGSFTDSRAHVRIKRCVSLNVSDDCKQAQLHSPYYSYASDVTLATSTSFCHPLLPSTLPTVVDDDDDDDESDSFCSSSTLLDSPSPSSSLADEECLISACNQNQNQILEGCLLEDAMVLNESPCCVQLEETRISAAAAAVPHCLVSCVSVSPSTPPTVSLVSPTPDRARKSLSRTTSTERLNSVLKRSQFAARVVSFVAALKSLVTVSLDSYLRSLNPSATENKREPVTRNQHARRVDTSASRHVKASGDGPLFKEMETFNVSAPQDLLLALEGTRVQFKQRDLRINSQFLRLYAHDYNLRCLGLMYSTDSDDEEYFEYLGNEYEDDWCHDLSNKSRQKLWKNVILPPRQDSHPDATVDGSSYVFVGHTEPGVKGCNPSNSLIRLKLKYLPWGQSHPSLKPAGDLRSGKVLLNGQSPNSGVTREQFTIRGWCNPRWLPQAGEEED